MITVRETCSCGASTTIGSDVNATAALLIGRWRKDHLHTAPAAPSAAQQQRSN